MEARTVSLRCLRVAGSAEVRLSSLQDVGGRATASRCGVPARIGRARNLLKEASSRLSRAASLDADARSKEGCER
jgi:hypothetical protein